ncbi:Tungstate-binding protein TupA [Polaromonas vacuolata]|uniref:Tungstate-binding protein TupA n=1 Tax=Polaromonas vacuolata TaxID=37448 RepID=A0A6H2H6P3_9BURK|nr:extracellular solute-binding protein [Polaromonas vacuolata]QJC55525.1 Tungstate-binding protein TupA [Polaromonas vacuolata]
MRKVLFTPSRLRKVGTLAVLSVCLSASLTWAQTKTMVMASTTSTEQSGLFSFLLPEFKKFSGIDIKVVAVGTGQAIDMGRRGDADLLFVHDQVAEEKVVAEGHVLKRFPVMYNDFVLAGPTKDPAQVKGKDVLQAFKKLNAMNADFVSRGDKSGTNAAELRYWKNADVETPAGKPGFVNYKACGCGMGQALNMAASTGSYVLVDRGSWLAFKNRADLTILVEGDKRLFNQYGVMAVNPAMHPQAKLALAQQFVDWITSPVGQDVIASYKINGQQLFFPNAAP